MSEKIGKLRQKYGVNKDSIEQKTTIKLGKNQQLILDCCFNFFSDNKSTKAYSRSAMLGLLKELGHDNLYYQKIQSATKSLEKKGILQEIGNNPITYALHPQFLVEDE